MSIAIKPFICKTRATVAEWSGRGRQPLHRKPQCTGQRVDQWVAARPADAWQRLTLREGEKGLLVADYLHAHVWVWDGEEEQARCWHLLCAGKSARTVSLTIVYRMRRWIRLGKSWHEYRRNVSLLNTVFASKKRMRHGRLSSPPLGCLAQSYGFGDAGNAIFG